MIVFSPRSRASVSTTAASVSGIEICGRLVDDEHFRVAIEGPRNSEPLTLAAGQPLAALSGASRPVHRAACARSHRAAPRAAPSIAARRRSPRPAPRTLRFGGPNRRSDRCPAAHSRFCAASRKHPAADRSVDQDRSRGRHQQAEYQIDQRRFAGAGRPDKADPVPPGYLDRDVVGGRPPLPGIGVGYVLQRPAIAGMAAPCDADRRGWSALRRRGSLSIARSSSYKTSIEA